MNEHNSHKKRTEKQKQSAPPFQIQADFKRFFDTNHDFSIERFRRIKDRVERERHVATRTKKADRVMTNKSGIKMQK